MRPCLQSQSRLPWPPESLLASHLLEELLQPQRQVSKPKVGEVLVQQVQKELASKYYFWWEDQWVRVELAAGLAAAEV